ANEDQDELFDLIMTGNYDFPSPYWDDVSSSAKNVISTMLEVNPELRLSATQVLEHRWIAVDTSFVADSRLNGSHGLNTFRRESRPAHNSTGIKVMTTSALDRASRLFRGRGSQTAHGKGRDI
ncbi:unnamed protein product, partial [Candidula unifasciata]